MDNSRGVDLTVSSADLANYFGVTTRQIANYRSQGMPVQASNVYNVRECIEWHVNGRVQAALKANQRPVQVDEEDLKLRKLEAEAMAKEIEVEQLRGGLVRVEDAKAELTKHLTSVRNGITSFPARTAPFLVQIQTERIARDILDREIVALMSYLQENAEVEDAPIDDSDEPEEQE